MFVSDNEAHWALSCIIARLMPGSALLLTGVKANPKSCRKQYCNVAALAHTSEVASSQPC